MDSLEQQMALCRRVTEFGTGPLGAEYLPKDVCYARRTWTVHGGSSGASMAESAGWARTATGADVAKHLYPDREFAVARFIKAPGVDQSSLILSHDLAVGGCANRNARHIY